MKLERTLHPRHPEQWRIVKARLLLSTHHPDVDRVCTIIGDDREMAAHMLAGEDDGTDALCARLEAGLAKLAKELFMGAKERTPVDTGALKQSIIPKGTTWR